MLVLAALSVAARASEDAPRQGPPAADAAPELLYLGLNDAGAEEWFRVTDRAVVVRVPAGPYLRRPYEGAGTTVEPDEIEVGSFLIDKYEVTNTRFVRFLNAATADDGLVDPRVAGIERDAGGSWRVTPGRENHPVTAATGLGAMAYAKWVGGALPDPDQWMKAAGGPEGRIYPWGDAAPDQTRANFARPAPRGPAPVGSRPSGASAYGCLDMAGNVYERVYVPGRKTRAGEPYPAMIKGGSWLTPHPLNLRVLDLCMQPLDVAERSVGFRVVATDPEPERATRTAADAPVLRLATDWDAAVAEARERRVPIFLSLLLDTCGQCDRTREQCYRDPRFIAYANANVVMIVGHAPGDAIDDPHAVLDGGACSLYPGITCEQHIETYRRGLGVIGGFTVSPGNFVLHPDRTKPKAGEEAAIAGEWELPKWGNAVDEYIAVFERSRAAIAEGDTKESDER